jgi:hypothetical protein
LFFFWLLILDRNYDLQFPELPLAALVEKASAGDLPEDYDFVASSPMQSNSESAGESGALDDLTTEGAAGKSPEDLIAAAVQQALATQALSLSLAAKSKATKMKSEMAAAIRAVEQEKRKAERDKALLQKKQVFLESKMNTTAASVGLIARRKALRARKRMQGATAEKVREEEELRAAAEEAIRAAELAAEDAAKSGDKDAQLAAEAAKQAAAEKQAELDVAHAAAVAATSALETANKLLEDDAAALGQEGEEPEELWDFGEDSDSEFDYALFEAVRSTPYTALNPDGSPNVFQLPTPEVAQAAAARVRETQRKAREAMEARRKVREDAAASKKAADAKVKAAKKEAAKKKEREAELRAQASELGAGNGGASKADLRRLEAKLRTAVDLTAAQQKAHDEAAKHGAAQLRAKEEEILMWKERWAGIDKEREVMQQRAEKIFQEMMRKVRLLMYLNQLSLTFCFKVEKRERTVELEVERQVVTAVAQASRQDKEENRYLRKRIHVLGGAVRDLVEHSKWMEEDTRLLDLEVSQLRKSRVRVIVLPSSFVKSLVRLFLKF